MSQKYIKQSENRLLKKKFKSKRNVHGKKNTGLKYLNA